MAKVHHIKTENKHTEQYTIIQIILMLHRFVQNIICLCPCHIHLLYHEETSA